VDGSNEVAGSVVEGDCDGCVGSFGDMLGADYAGDAPDVVVYALEAEVAVQLTRVQMLKCTEVQKQMLVRQFQIF